MYTIAQVPTQCTYQINAIFKKIVYKLKRKGTEGRERRKGRGKGKKGRKGKGRREEKKTEGRKGKNRSVK